MNVQGFNEALKAKLVAAGYTVKEMELGAIVAQMQGALKLVGHPLAVLAISQVFSKALAVLTTDANVTPERVCAAGDIIFDAAMGKAKEQLAELRREQVGDQGVEGSGSEQSGRRTVIEMDDRPAIDPKDIN